MSTEESAQQLSVIMIMAIGLSTVIGSGIWRDPVKWANAAGVYAVLGLLIAWLLFFSSGLAYAECVGMFPKSGGPYSFVGGAFGKKTGTFVGILYFLGYAFVGVVLSFLTALFTLAILDTGDFKYITDQNLAFFTLAYILIFGFIASYLELRKSGMVLLAWAFIKVAMLLIIALFAFTNMDTSLISGASFDSSRFQDSIALAIWALLGFDVMLIFAGEIEKRKGIDPEEGRKAMPKAIIHTLLIILIVYLIVALAVVGVIPPQSLQPSQSGTLGIMLVYASKSGVSPGLLFTFAAISAGGTTYALIYISIHQIRVLAQDQAISLFPGESFEIQRKRAIIVVASLFIFAAGMLAANKWIDNKTIDLIAGIGVGLILLSAMLPAGITALYLRVKLPILDRPYKAPLYFIVFPISIALSLYLIHANYSDFDALPWISIPITLGIMVLVFLYAWFKE